MAQWVNRLWNNIFVNLLPLPLSCEISGDLHLTQPDLTAGWQTKIQVNCCKLKYSSFHFV